MDPGVDMLLMLVAGCGGMRSNSAGFIYIRRQSDTDCVWLLSSPVGSQITVWQFFCVSLYRVGQKKEA